jgi:hypothetical protein
MNTTDTSPNAVIERLPVLPLSPPVAHLDTAPGAAVYSPLVLAIYNVLVHRVFNFFAWHCSVDELVELYDRNVTGQHLDIGVGTGYFLDKCHYPVASPDITLLDLNANTLRFCSHVLARFRPRLIEADVLRPLQLPPLRFRSVGLTYLLHCLPGNLRQKAVVFDHVRPYLTDDAVVFGATFLGRGVKRNLAAKLITRYFNFRGVFGNLDDTLEDLSEALHARYEEVGIRMQGVVAIFEARRPRALLAPPATTPPARAQ